MRLGAEGEAPRSAVRSGRRIERLQVLTLIGGDAGVRERAHVRVLGQTPAEQRRAATVQTADEDQEVVTHSAHMAGSGLWRRGSAPRLGTRPGRVARSSNLPPLMFRTRERC